MKKNKIITLQLLMLLAAGSFLMVSCQKKFDPNSYKPERTFGGFSSSNQIEPAALVAHLSFEGNLVDSVSKTSGQAFGTSYSAGIKGQALSVGLNNYALFPPTSGIKSLQSMSISFWVNTPVNTAGIQTPISFANASQFWGNFDMFYDGQSANGATFKIHLFGNGGAKEVWFTNWTLTNPWNSWQHFVLTYDIASNMFTFFVNGTQIGNSTQSGFGAPNFSSVPNIALGTIQFMTNPSLTTATGPQPWASYLLGSMDELRIYSKALTAKEVNALFQLENLGK